MKLQKRLLAAAAALCMTAAVTACSGGASNGDTTTTKAPETTASTAATTASTEKTTTSATTTTEAPLPKPADGAITFDTASLYTAHAGDDSGASKLNFDVVDLDGDKKLRVQVLDKDEKGYLIPKVIFDLPALLGEENVGKIGKIGMDFTCIARDVWKNDDGTESLVVGNFLGAVCGNLAAEKGYDKDGNLIQNDWGQTKSASEFALEDWNNPTHSWHFEVEYPLSKLPSNGYASKDVTYYDKDGNEIDIAKGQTLFIMRWQQLNQVDLYIDNLTFYDKDGKVMEIQYDAAGNTVEVKQDTMKVAAPADGTAADTPAETTTKAE